MKKEHSKKSGAVKSSATKLLALLFVICLIECTAGSCLSYGHSCWGAHGKRSGKLPAAAPDWYITRILRQMAAKAETNTVQQLADKNSDISAIYEADSTNNAATTKRLGEGETSSVDLTPRRYPEAIPMLDDDLIAKLKIWQILRQSSEEN